MRHLNSIITNNRSASINKDAFSRLIFFVLLGWTIIGFTFWLDNNEEYGCTIVERSKFSANNITYSLISISLLLTAYSIKQRQLTFLVIELVFWIYKLFYLKEGYAVGLTAQPIISVVWFDIIALTLRLILIKRIAQIPANKMFIIIPVFIIMAVRLGYIRYLFNS